MTFFPMAAADRASVRKEMEARLLGRLRQAVPGDGAAVRGDQQRSRLSRAGGAARRGSFKAVEIALLAVLLLAMVLMVFGNVVLRYVFNSGIVVSEELARFCFVWLTFIGAIVAVRDNAHLGMDNVVAALPRARKLACLAASQVLILMCCARPVLGHLAPARDQRLDDRRR